MTAPAPVTRRAPDDRLSRAASAIWRYRNADPDPMGDPSGDCGDLIAAYDRSRLLRAVTAAGYTTPGEYNTDLNRALGVGPPDEQDRTQMSYRALTLLQTLGSGMSARSAVRRSTSAATGPASTAAAGTPFTAAPPAPTVRCASDGQ